MPLSLGLGTGVLRLVARQGVDVRATRTSTLADGDKPRLLGAAHQSKNVPPLESAGLRPTRMIATPTVAVRKEITHEGKELVIAPKPWSTDRRSHGGHLGYPDHHQSGAARWSGRHSLEFSIHGPAERTAVRYGVLVRGIPGCNLEEPLPVVM